jgi:nicotinate-nucleotide adenylyltransferase
MKVAIFGGSFDPPTRGHMYVISKALGSDLDEVWVVPSKQCWFKPYRVDFATRLALVEAALSEYFRDDSRVRAMAIESEIPGVNVSTWELWQFLKLTYPDYEFTFLFGEDAWRSMSAWSHGRELMQSLPCLVIPRQPDGGISSSRARALIRDGRSAEEVIPAVVATMIRQHGWYQV